MLLLATLPVPVAAAGQGQLEVTSGVGELTYESPSTTLRILNAGDSPVRHVEVAVQAPAWAGAAISNPAVSRSGAATLRLGSLEPGESVLLDLTAAPPFAGRAGSIMIEASGESGGRVTAVTAISLAKAQPVASVDLSGPTEVADHSHGSLTVLVHNLGDTPIDVSLGANADGMILTEPGTDVADKKQPKPWRAMVTVEPHQVSARSVAMTATTPVRPRQVALLVDAAVTAHGGGGPAVDVTTSRDMTLTASASGLIPSVIGIGSVLVFPGLAAVIAFLLIREWDRGRAGVRMRNIFAVVWDDKFWLLLAAAISLAAIWACTQVSDIDLIEAPWRLALLGLVGVCAALAAAVSLVKVAVHRRRVPLINADSTAIDVIKAAAKSDPRRDRPVVAVSAEEVGTFVHHDYDLVVVAPRIWISRPGRLTKPGTTLTDIATAARTQPDELDVDFDRPAPAGWVARPGPVTGDPVWKDDRERLPRYRDHGSRGNRDGAAR